MGIFDEYLADWEFGERWRPIGERLAALAAQWPLPSLPADDKFTIYGGPGQSDGDDDGVLIWVDLPSLEKPGWVGVTLGAQIDGSGLRCGSVCSSTLSHFLAPVERADYRLDAAAHGLAQLTDEAVAWFGRKQAEWLANA
ncbi:hypothetical protein [Streptacidiphilus sp. P02-A3a]|uniref:hypothetical protein n=1 Tax=Streptacidiphilus sp. P02-A3a TaxID=2704468 RepID=UPI0015F80D2E|nr:hypothetical protein [Streptacidiphilus sp. P02-A3a]QMU70169.1 hypothetical protein GXP74_19975 [Streptacidiphilus sp. P02-A3a]QMU70381.1 hypothetical protein GXP74_21380 [Streptacidiphilus sp. P02-A3a]